MAFEPRYNHLTLDLRVDRVPSRQEVDRWLRLVMARAGVTVLGASGHDFPCPLPGGHAYTMAWILSASHAVIHTAPEHGWVHLGLATCGTFDQRAFCRAASAFFAPRACRARTFTTTVPGAST